MSHNAKAIHERCLGWYDGNPSDLNPLPPATFDASGRTFRNLPVGYILDVLAVRVVLERALKEPMRFDLVLIGEDDPQSIEVRNGVLIHAKIDDRRVDASRARTLKADRASLIAAVLNRSTSTTLSSDDAALLNRFSGLFETPRVGFGLVTSRPRGSPEERSSRAAR